MEVGILDIKNNFPEHAILQEVINDVQSRIQQLRIFDENTMFEPCYLYVGYGDKLHDVNFDNQNINIVCAGSADRLYSCNGRDNLNLLVLSNLSFSEICNSIQDLLNEKQRQDINRVKLLGSYFHGKSLQTILDIAYEFLSNPVYLLDTQSNLIAKSTKGFIDDALCQELTYQGRLKRETLDTLFGKNKNEMCFFSSSPQLFESNVLTYKRIISTIKLNKTAVMFFVTIDSHRRFCENDYDIIQAVYEGLTEAIQEPNLESIVQNMAHETLLVDLLENIIQNSDTLKKRLYCVHWQAPCEYKVYIIEIARNSATYLTFFRDMFQHLLDQVDIFYYKGYIIMVIGKSMKNPIFAEFEQKLATILRDNHMRCGVSSAHTDLLKLKEAFTQAKNALKLCNKYQIDTDICYNEDLLLYIVLDQLSSMQEIIHPLVRKLQQYDKENNGYYCQTLFQYLKNGKNASLTAQDLHIHKNTMTYRLKRLEDLIGIDWNNGYMLTQIYLSLFFLSQNGDL
ncbi:MAG: helix-turn-helix domain-containing protein [Lachnospiraceae bacterium]|nr:helix-turn-helix domain-containing protein [Lachnospiraceae bacterium]